MSFVKPVKKTLKEWNNNKGYATKTSQTCFVRVDPSIYKIMFCILHIKSNQRSFIAIENKHSHHNALC